MSNQPEHENQQPETATPQELRQSILAELEASQQVITQLNDEQLAKIVGGVIGKVPSSGQTPQQLWEQRKERERESQAAIMPVHNPHPVSPTSPIVSRESSTVSPALSRTSSSSAYSAQSNNLQQTLLRWFVGCFTCSR